MIPEHFEMIRTRRERFWWYVGRRHLFEGLLRRRLSGPVPVGMDAGCGPGTNETLYAGTAARWLCLDVDRESFSRWAPGPGCQGSLAHLSALPIREGAVDLILLLDVLEHLPEERTALTEVWRSLKPDGILLASVPAFMALWSWHDEQAGHHRRYRLRELRTLVADAGFEEVDALYFNSFLALPIYLVRKVARALPSMKHRIEAELSPGPLNGLFRRLLSAENRLALGGLRLPWGTTAVLVARKPRGENA